MMFAAEGFAIIDVRTDREVAHGKIPQGEPLLCRCIFCRWRLDKLDKTAPRCFIAGWRTFSAGCGICRRLQFCRCV